MKRTATIAYDIDLFARSDAGAAGDALDYYPLLEGAVIALHYSNELVTSTAILAAQLLIEAVNPIRPEESFDLPTLMAILNGELVFDREDLTMLKGLIPTTYGDLRVQVSGGRRHLEVIFSASMKDSEMRLEVAFTRANEFHRDSGSTMHATNGLYFPLKVTVKVWDGPDDAFGQSLRRGATETFQDRDSFSGPLVSAWIARVIEGP